MWKYHISTESTSFDTEWTVLKVEDTFNVRKSVTVNCTNAYPRNLNGYLAKLYLLKYSLKFFQWATSIWNVSWINFIPVRTISISSFNKGYC